MAAWILVHADPKWAVPKRVGKWMVPPIPMAVDGCRNLRQKMEVHCYCLWFFATTFEARKQDPKHVTVLLKEIEMCRFSVDQQTEKITD